MFSKLIAALESTGISVHHFRARKKEAPYIVWAEDGATTSAADDKPTEQTFSGTIDLFTRTEYDPSIFAVQKALSDAEIPWELLSIQYEDDTSLIHYEWGWELG